MIPALMVDAQICSTHVEMFQIQPECRRRRYNLLHACGDVSQKVAKAMLQLASAPRMWRCFLKAIRKVMIGFICSTHVEMFPAASWLHRLRCDLLHACGDVSHLEVSAKLIDGSAPRMWRCFLVTRKSRDKVDICSTHVEMFLFFVIHGLMVLYLLHACGDVSWLDSWHPLCRRSAPRMWRCFRRYLRLDFGRVICSTHVEMFPCMSWSTGDTANLLHACGDVSTLVPWKRLCPRSAPRMWRCFCMPLSVSRITQICSTHVEMFLWATMRTIGGAHLLHACGDVSHSASKTSLIL